MSEEPLRDDCILLEYAKNAVNILLGELLGKDVLQRLPYPEEWDKHNMAFCVQRPLGIDCDVRCGSVFTRQKQGIGDEERYYQCSKYRCKAQETLYFTNGHLHKTPKWKQERGNIYHVHRDKCYPAEELRGKPI